MDPEIFKWCDELGLKGKKATEFIKLHEFFYINVDEHIQLYKEIEIENDEAIEFMLETAETSRRTCKSYYNMLHEVSEREAAAQKIERKYKFLKNELLSKIGETPNPIIEVISTNNVMEIEKQTISSQVFLTKGENSFSQLESSTEWEATSSRDMSTQPELSERENARLLINEVSQFKDINSKLSDELCLLRNKEENQSLEIQQLRTELADAEKLKIRLIEKEIKMDEELKTAKSHLQKAESVLDEKDVTIKKISAMTETLDKKVDEAEQKMECYRTKCQLLEKEVAALREAHTEEVNQFQLELELKEALLEQKEQEVNTFQQEVKCTLQMSLASEVSENKSTKEKPENTELFDLRDRLRENESDKSSLLMQILSLQQELSDAHEITKSNQFSLRSDNPNKNQSQEQSETVHKKGRAKKFSKSVKECSADYQNSFAVSAEYVKCSETSSTNDGPVTRKYTRSGRATKAKKDITSSVTSNTKKNSNLLLNELRKRMKYKMFEESDDSHSKTFKFSNIAGEQCFEGTGSKMLLFKTVSAKKAFSKLSDLVIPLSMDLRYVSLTLYPNLHMPQNLADIIAKSVCEKLFSLLSEKPILTRRKIRQTRSYKYRRKRKVMTRRYQVTRKRSKFQIFLNGRQFQRKHSLIKN